MKNAIVILFSLLCISTVIYSTRSAESDSKYDITKPLNSSINRLFQNTDSASIEELVSAIENHKASNFETEVKFDANPFENKFYFTGINVTVLNSKWSEFNYDYLSEKLVLKLAKFSVRLEGYAGANRSEAFAGFIRSLDFKNLVITATQSDNLPNIKFQIDISSDSLEYHYIHLPWFRETLKEQEELEKKIKQTLPSVLVHNLNHNENFLQKLNQTFCKQATKKEIALTYRELSHQEEQFYCRTQNVSSFRIILSNITINGLSNFNTFKFLSNFQESKYYADDPEKHTLVLGNVRGKANLCYVTDNVTIFELYFQTENTTIWVNKKDQRIFVEAQNYSVIETKSNASLTKGQSEWVMEGIGRAIAATLMPSMKICKNKDQVYTREDEKVHPVVKLFGEISEKFRWSSLNESFSDWTPFNGSYTTTKLAFYPESYNYSISIHNMTIYPEIQNQYPYQMECHFFKMLQIIYNVDGNATGQVLFRNTTDETVQIDFLVRFSFADQIIKRKENAAYDFKLWLAYYREPFIVELSPSANYTLSDDEKSVIINQINDTLLSMTRQIMLHNAEPLLSLPLDFCTTPETPSDDFLPAFGDYQIPYVIPDGTIRGGQYFTSKIYNIILHGLSNFDLARISFNKKDVSNFDYDSNDESIGTFVEFPIYNITGRMGFNDSSVKFKELQLVLLNEMLLANATSEGKISVFPGYKYKLIPQPDDPGFSCYDSMWIMDKLEDIIENSLSKNEDSDSKSDYDLFSFERR